MLAPALGEVLALVVTPRGAGDDDGQMVRWGSTACCWTSTEWSALRPGSRRSRRNQPRPAGRAPVCDALGVDPRRTFFTDDSPDKLAGAIHIGMDARLYVGAAALRDQLTELGWCRRPSSMAEPDQVDRYRPER
jgi:hypothetical protein